jgi:predicted deacetylase
MGYSTIYPLPRHAAQEHRATPALRTVSLPGRPVFSVALHDVAPSTQARCERLIADVQFLGDLRFTLLVVPRYHHQPVTAAFERWIEKRLRAGDELVMHGFTHLDEAAPGHALDHVRRRWYTAGEGEFAALDRTAAEERLRAGREWFARRGWPLRGFVAPAWLLGAGGWHALAAQPFEYTCTLRHLVVIEPDRTTLVALEAWSIVYSTRAAWRRQASRLWNSAVARRQRHRRWMRFELHPGDADHRAIRAAALRTIGNAFDAAREPVTLGCLADQVRAVWRGSERFRP